MSPTQSLVHMRHICIILRTQQHKNIIFVLHSILKGFTVIGQYKRDKRTQKKTYKILLPTKLWDNFCFKYNRYKRQNYSLSYYFVSSLSYHILYKQFLCFSKDFHTVINIFFFYIKKIVYKKTQSIFLQLVDFGQRKQQKQNSFLVCATVEFCHCFHVCLP